MALLDRLGLARRSDVAALRAEVASLETRNRMLRAQSSGVDYNWGRFEYEQNEALTGSTRWTTYADMEGDAHIKGALRGPWTALVGATWEVQAASDKTKDVEIAEFCAANLLRTTNDQYGAEYWCQSSWRAQRLPEILDMLRVGFSLFAKSTREVNGKIVYDRLQWLEPESVDPSGWELDATDHLVSVKRTYQKPTGEYRVQEPIEARQLAMYVWELKGARLEGTPFIRAMYGAWYRKDWMQRQAMMWAQKVGAPVPFGVYPEGWEPALVTKFKSFVEQLRGTAPRDAYGVFPKSASEAPEVGYAGADVGDIDRMRSLIDGENAEIAHAGGTKSQLLGETATGAKAVAEPIGKVEESSVKAVAAVIEEWETHGVGNLPGLVEELVNWNFAGVKEYPRLICSKMSPLEGVNLVGALAQATEKGLVPKHIEVQKQVCGWFGLKLTDDVFEQAEEDAEAARERLAKAVDESGGEADDPSKQDTPSKSENDGGEEAEAEAVVGLAVSDVTRQKIADKWLQPKPGATRATPNGRVPNRLEADVCSLAANGDAYRVGERDLKQALSDVRWIALEEIMTRVEAGRFSRRNLKSQLGSKFRGAAKGQRAVKRVLDKIGDKGQEHVWAEIRRLREQR